MYKQEIFISLVDIFETVDLIETKRSSIRLYCSCNFIRHYLKTQQKIAKNMKLETNTSFITVSFGNHSTGSSCQKLTMALHHVYVNTVNQYGILK